MRLVPSQRALFCTGLLMPLSLLALVYPGLWVVPLGYAAVLLVIAVVDMGGSSGRFGTLRIEPEPVTRLARATEGRLTLHLRCDGEPPSPLTLGLPLPVEFEQRESTQQVALGGDGATHWNVSWELTGRARGIFRCPDVCAETPSRFGLFLIRRRFCSNAEIRVYANLRRERRQLANLFLNRGQIGAHAQRMVGQGREYEQLREYSAGDSMTDLHWKASAKRGELVTKTYQVERTQEIYLIIDHSRLSGLRATREDRDIDDDYAETVLERYVTAASVLGMVAEREGDHFGLVAFGKRVSRFVRASSGKQHGQMIQDALFDLKTERGPFDLDELFTFLRLRLRRRALLIFLTDLSEAAVAEEFRKHVRMVASQHVVTVHSIRRKGVHAMYSAPEDDTPSAIPEAIAGHLRWAGLRALQAELRVQGVEFSVIDDEKLSVDLVNQYLALKQRQVL